MELKPSQYEAALRIVRNADDALEHLAACIRRKEDQSRLRRGIDEVAAILKKLRQELGVG